MTSKDRISIQTESSRLFEEVKRLSSEFVELVEKLKNKEQEKKELSKYKHSENGVKRA